MTSQIVHPSRGLANTPRSHRIDEHAVSPARAEGAPAIPHCADDGRARAPEHGLGGDRRGEAASRGDSFNERKTEDGWHPDRLVPLLELVPWLEQWHNAPHDHFGGDGPGDWYERYVEAEARSLGKDTGDPRAWRPAKKSGRR